MGGGDRDRDADEVRWAQYRLRQRRRSRAVLIALVVFAAILYVTTYVRMSEVEERRHEMLDEPHRLAVPPGDSKSAH